MKTGEQLKIDGMKAAIDHADTVTRDWSGRAYAIVQEYLMCFGRTPFKAEDVRLYAELMDLPPPPHNRAWGSVFNRAKKIGIIRSIGTVKVRNPKAHSCYATLWVKN